MKVNRNRRKQTASFGQRLQPLPARRQRVFPWAPNATSC